MTDQAQNVDPQQDTEQEPTGVMVGNKEIFSTEMTIRLVEYNIEDYAGIHMPEDTSFVVKFPETGPAMVGVVGDQGIGKTSFMRGAMELLGGEIAKNSVNATSGRKNASITLQDTRNGMQYVAKFTKKSFSVSQIQEVGGKKQTLDVKTPKEFLRTLIGPLGVNPMELAEMKPDKQIAWVRDLFHLTDEQLAEEERITKGVKKATADRKNVARDMLRVRGELVANGYAKYSPTTKVLTPTPQYEEQKKHYTQDIAARQAEVSKAFEEANRLRNQYELDDKEYSSITDSRTNIKAQIEELKERIANLEKRNDQLYVQQQELGKKMGKEYVDKETVDKKYEVAQQAMTKMSQYVQGRSNLEKVDNALLEYDQHEELWKKHQSALDEYNLLHKNFVKLFTPDIEGIEICVPNGIDVAAEREMFLERNEGATDEEVSEYIQSLSPETREGIFYHGRSMDQLSESEVWETAMQFWSLNGVNVAFIENVQSLGSKAKERIEWLAQKGCTIFFSAMKRSEKELKAEFYQSIPE